MAIKVVILDFDGIILESNNIKMSAYDDLFEDYPEYRDAMINYHRKNYTQTRVDKFRFFIKEIMNREHSNEFELMMRRFSHYVVERMKTCPYVPGAKAFLDEFFLRVPLYVSSLMPQEELNEIIKTLGVPHYFAGIFGNPPYTKENAIGEILAEANLSPGDALFIGDSISDYLASFKTGIEFIGRDRDGSFDGSKFPVYKNLYEIAEIIRPKLAN